ncbi:MAG TPA: hypothetical protein VEW67_03870 [Thermoleophilaceae bacterium]|nr:hypothetical protein [Thermoleophilaceae bacterium]
MGDRTRSAARFPELPLSAGHYESFYLKATHPTDPVSVWIRYTVHKRPGAAPRGSLWFTLFDSRENGPWAVKTTTEDVGADPGEHIHVGEARFEPGRVFGAAVADVGSDRREAYWDLSLDSPEPPFRHLPRELMYRAPLPRTKLLSPYPDARFSGRVQAGGRTVELDGWRGMVGHNWGAQHAERWIWLHGAGFDGHEDAWIDAALGRIAIGPWTTPWIANGVLSLDGIRHRLGGLGAARRTEVSERPDGATFTLPGGGITVQGQVGADRKDFVGWVYADPDGSEHNTVNCSIANLVLTVSRPALPPLTLQLASGAVYELGMRETDHGMAIQPFPDG